MASAAPVPAPRPRPSVWLAAACLVAAVVGAYFTTLNAPFVFDDAGAVQHNRTIRELASLDSFRPPADGSTTTGRPLVNFTFALNYAVSGEKVWSYHATNIALHTLAALTLFGVVRRTLARVGLLPSAVNAMVVAAFCALLWALHPLQTETVTCIAQRTEGLCGLLYLFTVYGFVRAVDAGTSSARRGWLSASVIVCALGMTAKEVMVTAPVLVVLFDRTFVAGNFSAAWRERRGYYVSLAATWVVLGMLLIGGAGARGVSAGFGLGVSWWSYLFKQAEALVLYLRLTLWPHPLVVDYGTAVRGFDVAVVWWGSVVLALLVGTWWALWRRPVLGFVGACFFLVLAPSSSVVPLVTQTMAEHRMYLPLAGLLTAAVVAGFGRFGRAMMWPVIAASVLGGLLTVARNRDYRDAVTLWTETVRRVPTNPRAHNNLGQALVEAGRAGEAAPFFARAIELDPGYVSARYNFAVSLLAQGQTAESVAPFEAVLRLAPDHADAHLNLGTALMRLHRAAEAVPHYERALALVPGADAHYNLGIALLDTKRTSEAVGHFRSALRLSPAMPAAHYQLARLAEQAGDAVAAEAGYLATLRLAPDHLDAHRRLGLLLARQERLPEAAAHFRAVIRVQPGDADAHANLGNVLLLSGQPREAIASYEESLRLRPGDARTRENLQAARDAAR